MPPSPRHGHTGSDRRLGVRASRTVSLRFAIYATVVVLVQTSTLRLDGLMPAPRSGRGRESPAPGRRVAHPWDRSFHRSKSKRPCSMLSGINFRSRGLTAVLEVQAGSGLSGVGGRAPQEFKDNGGSWSESAHLHPAVPPSRGRRVAYDVIQGLPGPSRQGGLVSWTRLHAPGSHRVALT